MNISYHVEANIITQSHLSGMRQTQVTTKVRTSYELLNKHQWVRKYISFG